MINFRKFFKGLNIRPKASTESNEMGDLEVLSSDTKLHYHNGTTTSPVLTEGQAGTLTNKTIDADQNTITNIENADIKAGAAIDHSKLANSGSPGQVLLGNGSSVITATTISGDATISGTGDLQISAGVIVDADVNASAAIAVSKLAALTASRALKSDGSGVISPSAVTSTELGYLSGVTSAVQTQLGGKASIALDNLASVAINTSLVSDTNNTDDLGSDAIEWKDAYVHSIKHGDATNPNLNVQTTSNNGSVIVTAHGTGDSDVKATRQRRSENGASSNFVEEQYLDALTLTASQTDAVQSSLTFAHASFEGIEITYKIKEATTNRVRVGTLRVATNGTDVSAVDTFAQTADVGVSWSAAVNGANIEVKYTTTANNKTMRADVKRLRA